MDLNPLALLLLVSSHVYRSTRAGFLRFHALFIRPTSFTSKDCFGRLSSIVLWPLFPAISKANIKGGKAARGV